MKLSTKNINKNLTTSKKVEDKKMKEKNKLVLKEEILKEDTLNKINLFSQKETFDGKVIITSNNKNFKKNIIKKEYEEKGFLINEFTINFLEDIDKLSLNIFLTKNAFLKLKLNVLQNKKVILDFNISSSSNNNSNKTNMNELNKKQDLKKENKKEQIKENQTKENQKLIFIQEINCAENSSLNYIEINNDQSIFSTKNFNLEENSNLSVFFSSINCKNIVFETNSNIEKNASFILNNVFVCSKNQKHEFNFISNHLGEKSVSLMKSKGVADFGEASIKGLVKIYEQAKDSTGYQKSDVLILNDSNIISIPDLEIHNDKVKCSHGSSITRLDKNKIFYLQSRGLSEKSAKHELIKSFYAELLTDIKNEELKNKTLENFEKIIN